MLVLWCRQSEVNRLVAAEPCGNNVAILYQTYLNVVENRIILKRK